MLIMVTLVYRWGDQSRIVYDLNSYHSRMDCHSLLVRLRNGDKDVTHWEFHRISRISENEIVSEIQKYPTHDPA